MPFLPLFIVIGLFLAGSKILRPNNQQYLQSASEDYDEQLLNRALIDYIARESRTKSDSEYVNNRRSKSGKRASDV
ncbi:MAG: hypothetical protein AAGA46_12100 [Cyanobacteria bacterium P01_F01_bin.13]